MAQNKKQIINFDDARKAVNSIIDAQQTQQQERKSTFEALMAEVEKVNPSMGGFEELSMLLSLPYSWKNWKNLLTMLRINCLLPKL